MSVDRDKIQSFSQCANGKVVLGIDGFIDEVWEVVETRIDATEYEPMRRMKQFGDLIVERGSGGLAKERIRKRRTCGGFTGNTSRAISRLGINTTMVGTYGEGQIDPAFDEFTGNAIYSIGEPVVCSILEFTDGKIMMPHLEGLLQLDWKKLKAEIDKIENGRVFEGADVVGLGYWSNMPDFDNILVGLMSDYFKPGSPSRLFFDFANITKKSVEALKHTLSIMKKLNDKIPMTLSLNEHEGELLYGYYNIKNSESDATGAITELRDKIGLDEIIIHTPHFAAIATANEGSAYAEQETVQNPVRTAGAGDSFNGGYVVSSLGNLNPDERLTIANAVTRFYVTNGYPPDKEQLTQII